jgi:HlyD family secretion protein
MVGRLFAGRVVQIRKSPDVVQNVVTYTTVISAPNPDLLMLPGMTAQLRIVVSDAGKILKIPNEALRFHPAGITSTPRRPIPSHAASSTTVWVVGDDAQPMPISVRLGVSDDNSTELMEGALREGQPLITGVANSQTQIGYFSIRLGF